MRKVLLTLSMFVVGLVQAANFSFVVWTNAGEQIAYDLDVRPKLTDSADMLILSTNETTVEYPKADVAKFTLQSRQSKLEHNAIENNPIQQMGERILLNGCQVGTLVRICDINGRVLFLESVDNTGAMEISLAEYPKGLYIISVNKFTYKIIKK